MINRNLATAEDRARLPIQRIEVVYFAILLVLLAAVFAFNAFVAGGTISSVKQLAIDSASWPYPPQYWGIQYWPAAINRVLFRWIIQGTWTLFCAPDDAWGFYIIFIAWSFALFYGTLVALYFFLRLLDFSRRMSFGGCLLFLACAPVLLAYKYPVATREDPLAYFLIVLGLVALFKSRPILFTVIATAAALTRETTLILPLAYFLASGESLRQRVLVFIPPVLAFFGIRLVTQAPVPVNQLEASLLNFLFPWELIAFLFCAFGALWAPYLIGMRERRQYNDALNFPWRVLITTGPIILVLILGTSVALGRAREIRPTFLIFPWVIAFALDWFSRNRAYLARLAARKTFWVFAFSIFAGLAAIVLYFNYAQRELTTAILADFRNGYWLVLGTINLAITLALFLPRARSKWLAEQV